jgi:hypothetical protein
MKTAKLLFWSAIAYSILLLLVRGALPLESSPTISLLAIPLIVIAVIMARDLGKRSTSPVISPTTSSLVSPKENPVQFLSGQIRVAASASDSYFENVVRARLKELLITKIAFETGMERNMARRAMSDPKQALKLLSNEKLYTLLYGPVPETGSARMDLVEVTVDLIGAWKG